MPSRRLVPLIAATAVLVPAAVASARPADVVPAHAVTHPRTLAGPVLPPATPDPGASAVVHPSGGADTATVVAVAGGTLLLGAATGFGAGGALGRRRAVGH